MFDVDPDRNDNAVPKLIDFGTCVECLLTKKIRWVAGTALYLAPEVCMGFLELNSDMWAVGLMVRRRL